MVEVHRRRHIVVPQLTFATARYHVVAFFDQRKVVLFRLISLIGELRVHSAQSGIKKAKSHIRVQFEVGGI